MEKFSIEAITNHEPDSNSAIQIDEILDYTNEITKSVYTKLGQFEERKEEYEDKGAIFLAAFKFIDNDAIYRG